MTDLIGRFVFEIKQWCSNNYKVDNVVKKTKVVGLTWDLHSDTLASVLQSKVSATITKRRMLAKLSEIWDGFNWEIIISAYCSLKSGMGRYNRNGIHG